MSNPDDKNCEGEAPQQNSSFLQGVGSTKKLSTLTKGDVFQNLCESKILKKCQEVLEQRERQQTECNYEENFLC